MINLTNVWAYWEHGSTTFKYTDPKPHIFRHRLTDRGGNHRRQYHANSRSYCANKVGDLLTAPCSRPTCQLGVKSLLIAINHSQTDRPRAFSSPWRGECWALSYRLCVFHAFCVICRPIMIKILMQIVSNCTSLNFLGG